MPRFNEINNTINKLEGFGIVNNTYFFSSSECHINGAYALGSNLGNIDYYDKGTNGSIRPFATIAIVFVDKNKVIQKPITATIPLFE